MGLEVLHLILCQRVETDPANYHQLNIYGLITSIRPSTLPLFPLRQSEMVALVVWTGGEGTGEPGLRIIENLSGAKTFQTRSRQVRFVGDAAAIGGVLFVIRNCVFPRAGL